MRRIARVSVALSALVTSFLAPASEASPPTPGPRGRVCSYNDLVVVGLVSGGPLIWDRNFWLHCHVQVDNNTHTGPVASGGDVHGPSDPHDGDTESDEVAVVSGQFVDYSSEDSQKYLCTSVSWPDSTGPNWLYWNAGNSGPDGIPGTEDDETGHWTPNSTRPCPAVTQISTRPVIDVINEIIVEYVDSGVCLALQQLHPDQTETWGDKHDHDGPNSGQQIYVDAEGDVFVDDGDGLSENDWPDDLWWDCLPHTNYDTYPPSGGPDGAAGGVIDI